MAATNKGLNSFLRARPLPAVGGRRATTGLDFFLRGRPMPDILSSSSLSPVRRFFFIHLRR